MLTPGPRRPFPQDKVAYNKDALTQVLKKEGGDGVGLQEVFHGGDRTTVGGGLISRARHGPSRMGGGGKADSRLHSYSQYQMKMKQFKGQKQKVGDDLQPVMGSLR